MEVVYGGGQPHVKAELEIEVSILLKRKALYQEDKNKKSVSLMKIQLLKRCMKNI